MLSTPAITFWPPTSRTDGGKIILSAVSLTTGRDEEQMLLALRQVMSGEPALPTSVGVTWGRIFAGEGTPTAHLHRDGGRGEPGCPAHMAAPAGEIYATSEVVTGSRTTFAVSPRAIHGQGQEAP